MSTDIAEIAGMQDLVPGLRAPAEILSEAEKRATALKDVVKRTNGSQNIGGHEHLKVESWITVGQFYNCTARCKEAEFVEMGGIEGFKAHAYLVHDQTQAVLSEAVAYCMRDEDKWRTRSKYEWIDGVKTKVADENVPLFQLAAMAQTRAIARALANKFRWVVLLAGYHATPAEEMTGNEQQADATKRTPKEEKRPPLTLPWTHSKGKTIDDPSVPIEDLQDVLEGKQRGLEKPERKKWEAKDKIFIAALKEEIAKRMQANVTEAWGETVTGMRTKNSDALALACEEFGVDDADAILVDDRFRFAERWAHYVAQLSAK